MERPVKCVSLRSLLGLQAMSRLNTSKVGKNVNNLMIFTPDKKY